MAYLRLSVKLLKSALNWGSVNAGRESHIF